MAQAMGDSDFAKECWELAAKGRAYVDRELFNGRYYVQKLDLSDRSVLERFDQNRKAGVLRESFMEAYWSDEYGEIKYQIGEGCLTDQILGQWHADIAGLGDLLAPAKILTALKTVFEQNYLADLRDHFNPCRVYAYENEGGLLNCTWPEGANKPALPVPYAEEVWTGLEYMMASHLIQRGLTEEGLIIVRSARARHDGSRRNPWNDMECGSYYIRALSSYALVNAYSGFIFDQRIGEIGLKPARSGDGIYFWSAGRGWGVIDIKNDGGAETGRDRDRGGTCVTITVKGGELAVSRLRLPSRSWSTAMVDGQAAGRDDDAILLQTVRTLKTGDSLSVELNTDGEA
jgi:non-lysosomal glucosylceramidase